MPRPRNDFGEDLPGRLLVEGTTDSHFFSHLFVKRGIYHKLNGEVQPKGFGITAKGSYSEVRDGLGEELKVEHLDTVGVVVDADENLADRWKDLRGCVLRLGYSDVPENPSPAGCILDGKKRLGIWLMPDNTIDGILEHFISWMIPERGANRLWQHVEQSIETIPGGQIFEKKDLAKAQLSTWLAWQKEPGHPIGLAVTKGYIEADARSVDSFIDWIKRLFQLS